MSLYSIFNISYVIMVQGLIHYILRTMYTVPAVFVIFLLDSCLVVWFLMEVGRVVVLEGSHERRGVLNFRPLDCLSLSLWGPTSKKTSQLCLTGHLWRGIHQWPVVTHTVGEYFISLRNHEKSKSIHGASRCSVSFWSFMWQALQWRGYWFLLSLL